MWICIVEPQEGIEFRFNYRIRGGIDALAERNNDKSEYKALLHRAADGGKGHLPVKKILSPSHQVAAQ